MENLKTVNLELRLKFAVQTLKNIQDRLDDKNYLQLDPLRYPELLHFPVSLLVDNALDAIKSLEEISPIE